MGGVDGRTIKVVEQASAISLRPPNLPAAIHLHLLIQRHANLIALILGLSITIEQTDLTTAADTIQIYD